MKKKFIIFFSLSLLLCNNIVNAQSNKDSIEISINPYLLYRGHLAVYDKEIELQENVSRIGGKIAIKKGQFSFLAATELHINLFQGGANFNVDGNTSGEFLDITTTQNTQTFTNRLGYIGLNIEKYGTLTFGKQWSVYYDVTSYTDTFIVFGGRASATYIGGTDGGKSGTGRADQSIIYRNKMGKFYLGAQAQLYEQNNNKLIDGFGFSAQYLITKELLIGTSFNRILINKNLINEHKIIGLKGYPTYYAAGFKFQGEKLTLGLIGAIEKNGDFAQGSYFSTNQNIVYPTVVFDAKGIELYTKYNFNLFSIHGGYNYYKPDTKQIEKQNNQLPVSSKFEVNDLILGFTYNPFRFVKFYTEQRISFGRNALNVKDKSVFTLGMIINLSKTFNTKVALDDKSN